MIEIRNVSFTYAGSEQGMSLKNISIVIPKGKVTVLCGRSGCGKTTMARLINGLVPYFYKGEIIGDILIDGESVIKKNVQQRAGMVGSVFQNPRSQFFNVDSTSELVFGCENMEFSREEMDKQLCSTTQLFEIEGLVNKNLFKMSGGEKQKIACASVSMMGPDIYVLDEPTSNLDILAIKELAKVISLWKLEGKTIVIADHRLNYLKDIADKVVLMEDGHIVWEKEAEDFYALSDIEAHSYGLRSLGSHIDSSEMPKDVNNNQEVLTVNNLDFNYENGSGIHIENLAIPMGSIIGIVGENGAGKSTLVRCLCGLQKNKGSYNIGNRRMSPKDLLKNSYLVMQDVNHQLFTESVDEEIIISIPKGKRCNQNEILKRLLEDMDLDKFEKIHPMSLSGGQKQRVAVATALASEKKILFFDEPTSGLDYEHMKEFSIRLKEVRNSGITPVVITHDIELIQDSCDYLILVSQGSVKWSGRCDATAIRRIQEHFDNKSFRIHNEKKTSNEIIEAW